jgi:hypothetical protein
MKDAERWMRCIKQECLSRLILFGEGSLRRALSEFLDHYRRNGITKAKATCCCFLRAIRTRDQLSRRFGAGSDWAVFLTNTPMPREVFDHMGMQFGSQHVNSAVGGPRGPQACTGAADLGARKTPPRSS